MTIGFRKVITHCFTSNMLALERLAPRNLAEFVTFLPRSAGAVGPGLMTFHRQDRGGRAVECSIVDVRSTNMGHANRAFPRQRDLYQHLYQFMSEPLSTPRKLNGLRAPDKRTLLAVKKRAYTRRASAANARVYRSRLKISRTAHR